MTELLTSTKDENYPAIKKDKEPWFDFSTALNRLKQGQKLSRAGWNGKGMFIYLNYGSFDPAGKEQQPYDKVENIGIHLFEKGAEGTTTRLPNINMMSASGSIVTGWLASQTDLLAEDWGTVK